MSSRSSRRYWARYDRLASRDFEREEQHFEQHGSYSLCAGGCGRECNPSNVHANGKKYCDECWNSEEI